MINFEGRMSQSLLPLPERGLDKGAVVRRRILLDEATGAITFAYFVQKWSIKMSESDEDAGFPWSLECLMRLGTVSNRIMFRRR